jgi:circadian clock protein KaiC
VAGRIYMVCGQPGTGKTTLAMQFLLDGVRQEEPVLFVTLSESEQELRANSAAHGWDVSRVHFLDIHPAEEALTADSQYAIFHPADVELAPVTKRIIEAVDRLKPARIVFDSLTEIRLLSRDPLRYRRQVLSLKSFLLTQGATCLLLGESGEHEMGVDIASMVNGVIALRVLHGKDGMARRSVEVEKYRGSDYVAGQHALRIAKDGLEVFPRLLALAHREQFTRQALPSGVAELDRLLGGGLDRGTSTLITGHAGVGKTTLGTSLLIAAAQRGERGVLYTFDEGPAEVEFRCESLGMPARDLIGRGLLQIQKVNPLLLYPDEFVRWVRREVEQNKTQLIMIDSLNGYRYSMPDEDFLVGHMHQLLSYLNRMGITSILVNEVSNLIGDFSATDFGISYLTDALILIKYYEYQGALHKAIGTLKKRLSDHEKMFRSFEITGQGLNVGGPLPHMRGILRGEVVPDGNTSSEESDRQGSSHA